MRWCTRAGRDAALGVTHGSPSKVRRHSPRPARLVGRGAQSATKRMTSAARRQGQFAVTLGAQRRRDHTAARPA